MTRVAAKEQAQLLVARSFIQQELIARLYDSPAVPIIAFQLCLPYLDPESWHAVIQERISLHLCAYPCCSQSVSVTRRGHYSIDLKNRRVIDITPTFSYCSDTCFQESERVRVRLMWMEKQGEERLDKWTMQRLTELYETVFESKELDERWLNAIKRKQGISPADRLKVVRERMEAYKNKNEKKLLEIQVIEKWNNESGRVNQEYSANCIEGHVVAFPKLMNQSKITELQEKKKEILVKPDSLNEPVKEPVKDSLKDSVKPESKKKVRFQDEVNEEKRTESLKSSLKKPLTWSQRLNGSQSAPVPSVTCSSKTDLIGKVIERQPVTSTTNEAKESDSESDDESFYSQSDNEKESLQNEPIQPKLSLFGQLFLLLDHHLTHDSIQYLNQGLEPRQDSNKDWLKVCVSALTRFLVIQAPCWQLEVSLLSELFLPLFQSFHSQELSQVSLTRLLASGPSDVRHAFIYLLVWRFSETEPRLKKWREKYHPEREIQLDRTLFELLLNKLR